jgi:hypothetical protein
MLAAGSALAVSASPVRAQDSTPPDLNSLRTPPSPAFVLLGVEPSSVERPSTPADFAVTVLNGTQNFTTIPRDFALEVSPYWMFGHPKQNWEGDVHRNVLQSLWRTFTVSAATAEVGANGAPVTGAGVSVRAALASGHLVDSAGIAAFARQLAIASGAELRGLKHRLDAATRNFQAELARATTVADTNAATDRFDRAKLSFLDDSSAATEADTLPAEAANQSLQVLASARAGFFLEVAGGAVWDAPSAAIDSASLARWGAWMTASYQMTNLSFLGVFRYLGGTGVGEDAGIDVGFRVLYAQDRYGLSAEYVDRHFTGGGARTNEWRLAGVVDYRLNKTFWLVGTFGRDYAPSSAGSLLAQIGVSLQFSRDRAVADGTK